MPDHADYLHWGYPGGYVFDWCTMGPAHGGMNIECNRIKKEKEKERWNEFEKNNDFMHQII